ncbi:hypothetical protein AB0L10_43260 [Streptomyces flaveolus]|uniref:hypothetical protein n=1 Tax=Streptomyces flaveolus TaxID=67297 RepID=UPI0034446919
MTLPALTEAFDNLRYIPRANIIEQRPDPYFTPFLTALLKDVGTFNRGQEVAEKGILPCASFLSLPELEQVLTEWNDSACAGVVQCPATSIARKASSPVND